MADDCGLCDRHEQQHVSPWQQLQLLAALVLNPLLLRSLLRFVAHRLNRWLAARFSLC